MSVFVSNVATDTIEFNDPEVAFVSVKGAGIANIAPTSTLDVGSNLSVNDELANVLTVRGGVVADSFEGDGSLLGNLVMTSDFNDIMSRGANTVYFVEFQNAETAFTTTSNVGIANTSPVHTLDVGSNLYIDDAGMNVLFVSGNIGASGNLMISGNIMATHFVGDGTLITNVKAVSSLESATTHGNTTSHSVKFQNPTLSFTTTSNVGISNISPIHTLDVGSKFWVDENSANTMFVDGVIVARGFVGDGNLVTNVVSSTDLEASVNNGNVTSNTVQFANNETAFVTFSNVGICNVDPVHNLDVGSNLYVIDDAGDDEILTVTGNIRSYYFKGDGRYLTNVPVCSICSTFNYVTNIGNTTANTVRFVHNTVSLITESNVGIANEFPVHTMDVGSNIWFNDDTETKMFTTGNIVCSYITADASNLYNFTVNLDQVVNNDNVTANVVRLAHPSESLVIASNIKFENDILIDATAAGSSIMIGGIQPDGPVHSPGFSEPHRISIGNEAGQLGQSRYAVAIGHRAGNEGQGLRATAIGRETGEVGQGSHATAVGDGAGNEGQNAHATAIGYRAGIYAQGPFAVAIGTNAASSYQSSNAVAIGEDAGRTSQGLGALAIGSQAGTDTQGANAFAIGHGAGRTSQGDGTMAMGHNAGEIQQGSNAIAIGYNAGQSNQNSFAIAIGFEAGLEAQGEYNIGIGHLAGSSLQGAYGIAMGYNAGRDTQGEYSQAMGFRAGQTSQGAQSIAWGFRSGDDTQGANAIAIGYNSGRTSQGYGSVAIGGRAGFTNQSANSVAIGTEAGKTNQGENCVALGFEAGTSNQGANSFALGVQAASVGQGRNSIVIGHKANAVGDNTMAFGSFTDITTANTICFNATDQYFNPGLPNATYITPLRRIEEGTDQTGHCILTYTNNCEVVSMNNFFLDEKGNVYLYANLIVTGAFAAVSSQSFVVDDSVLVLAANNALGTLDMGIIMGRNVSAEGSNVLMGYMGGSDQELVFAYTQDDETVTTFTPQNYNLHTHFYGSLETDGNVYIAFDSDSYAQIGRSNIGFINGLSDHASFTHVDSPQYALSQISDGTTYINTDAGQTIRFRSDNSDLGYIDGATGQMYMMNDIDTYHHFGKAAIGVTGTHLDSATFTHQDFRTNTNYALRQGSGGTTFLNARSAVDIRFRSDDVDVANVNSNGINMYTDKVITFGDGLVTLSEDGIAIAGVLELNSDGMLLYGESKITSDLNNPVLAGNLYLNSASSYITFTDASTQFDGSVNRTITTNAGPVANGGTLVARDANGDSWFRNVNGSGTITAPEVTATSDIRLKSNIVKIDNSLEKIDKLNGYTFTMNDKQMTGLVAQEVFDVLPEAVIGNEEGIYSLAYGNMVGLLVEGIKELKKEVAELKEQLKNK
jgi:roadblock/LC7 domain-containing protein